MSFRLRLNEEEYNLINDFRNGVNVSNVSETESNDYQKPFIFNAIGDNGKLLNIEDYCIKYGLDYQNVRSYKLISHTATPYYNVVFNSEAVIANTLSLDFIESTVAKYIKPIEIAPIHLAMPGEFFDRLVISDIHIGMDVNGGGNPLYDGKWDREELLSRADSLINFVNDNSTSTSLLVIDNLGDYLDGQDGKTTRKGHDLPQNMNNKECFDLGIEFSLKIIEPFVNEYENIVYNFVTCDNHSGDFSYYVGMAIKGILEAKYSNVKVNVIKKFIHHYSIGNHTFVLCHGKDDEALKFGFKPHLDRAQASKIDHYLKENNLYDGKYIEFSKGDSHQSLFDESTSTDFHYYNYPAFSPPSNWVKTNFSNSRSGFRMFNIRKNENIKVNIPFWF